MGLTVTVRASVRGQVRAEDLARLRTRATRMLRAVALSERPEAPRALVCGLTLVDDAEIRELNRDFRKKDKYTDVLAFAMREGGGPIHLEELGDVVISVPTARRQAKRGLYRELEHLWAHGLCHLLGYDHRTDAEETAMNARALALVTEAQRKGRTRAA
jgi:probable rRNA maturation factor